MPRLASTPIAEQTQTDQRAADLAARCHGRLDAWLAAGEVDTLVLAYSGGLDSSVLLHLLRDHVRQRGCRLIAFHVDHALHPDSATWTEHCAAITTQLGIEFASSRLTTLPPSGASVEDWARQQRYQALLAHRDTRSAVLTAHHQDDQAETLLLHALRGSGPHGLAGIRARARYGETWLWRPLLDETRAQLRHYAYVHQLSWIEDPSNVQQRFARNRMRGAVLPVLEQNFPGASAALAQVARLQSEVVEVLDALADQVLGDRPSLPLASLHGSAAPLRPYLIKRWLARRGAPPPGRAQLQQLLHEMVIARRDGQPSVIWRGVAVRRHDDHLFLTAAELPVPSAQSLDWRDAEQRWMFAHGALSAHRSHGTGLDAVLLAQAPLTLRYRQGGERLRLHAGGPRRELKHLFQQWRIPPWQRARWPLVYVGDQLAAVAGYAVAAEFLVAGEAAGVVFEWQPRD